MECRICGNVQNNKDFTVKEMMFGLMDEFVYYSCGNCGALQIKNVPQDMNKYYPKDYYSFSCSVACNRSTFKKLITNKRLYWYIKRKGVFGKILSYIKPIKIYDVIGRYGATLNSSILDVGCGSGSFLQTLKNEGFNNLTGIDRYIDKNINFGDGFQVVKGEIFDIKNIKYDAIFFNHSFEHIFEQQETLLKAKSILNKDGFIIIRVPIADSWAYMNYGTDWVQLDAPRHFFIHTNKSMDILSRKVNCCVVETLYDSGALQIIGSDGYKNGVPLRMQKHTKEQIKAANKKADKLNLNRSGDQVAFVIKHLTQ
jgi:SAM-dependent methyltransferase